MSNKSGSDMVLNLTDATSEKYLVQEVIRLNKWRESSIKLDS